MDFSAGSPTFVEKMSNPAFMSVCFEAEGKYFSSRYIVDCEPDIEYFDTIEEACDHLSAYIGKPVNASWQALNEAADEWNDEHPDSDWSINVKQIEVISDDEMCSLTD